MKSLLTLALLFSLPHTGVAPAPRAPQQTAAGSHRKGGRWYLAESGHAVYCLGPVRILTKADGNLQRVATFCQGDQIVVPLKD
jgi:hypothetical protein